MAKPATVYIGFQVTVGCRDQPDIDRLQAVTGENLGAVNRLAERGRSFVTLPLIGFETRLASGKEGEFEEAVLLEQNIGKDDFRIAANPDLGSRGARRAALLKVSPNIEVEGDSARLEFFLPKGSYATVLLREYTKGANAVAISDMNKPEDLETCN